MEPVALLMMEARAIVEVAKLERRELTDRECDRCDALLDAANALSRLAKLPLEYAA